MQDPENRLNAVPMYGQVIPMDHGGHPIKMVVDLEWLSPLKSPLMEAHDQLGSYGGFIAIFIFKGGEFVGRVKGV